MLKQPISRDAHIVWYYMRVGCHARHPRASLDKHRSSLESVSRIVCETTFFRTSLTHSLTLARFLARAKDMQSNSDTLHCCSSWQLLFLPSCWAVYQGYNRSEVCLCSAAMLGIKYHYILITNRIYVRFYLIFLVRLFEIYLFAIIVLLA